MRKYRIIQIGENKFIPQVRKHFYGSWYGIDKNYKSDFYLYEWFIKDYQEEFCTCTSLKEAEDIIYNHDFKVKQVPEYPKYHKYKFKLK